MAALEPILAGVAGALTGGAQNYQWQRTEGDRNAQLTEENRIKAQEADLKSTKDARDEADSQKREAAQQAIIESMPDTNPDGSPNQLKTALRVQYASPKGTMGSTMLRQQGADQRHDTASGNAIANNAGALARQQGRIDFGYDKTFLTEQGKDNRWAAPSGNATLGADTSVRGQDVRASTARRGQDIGASTAIRGQDIGAGTASRGQDVTQRGQNASFALGTARNAINQKKAAMFDNMFATPGAPLPAADPGAAPTPPDAVPPAAVPSAPVGLLPALPRPTVPRPGGQIPVTPRAGATHAPAADPMTALQAKAEQLMTAFKMERDPVKKTALAAQLATLKQQRDALVAAGGGG